MSASGTRRRWIGVIPQTKEAGFVLMALAMLLVPMNDVMSKLLTDRIQPVEIAFWRFLFQGVILLAVTVALTGALPRRALAPGLALGGITSAATLVFLISAFTVMPIATAISIFFVEPLILTLLSAWILGEKTGWRRYLAVAVGLAGAVVVIRPSWSTFGVYAILPLGAALAFALNMILIRRLAPRLSGLEIQCGMSFYATLILGAGLTVGAGLGWFSWAALAAHPGIWPYFTLMGALSGISFLMIAEAFRRVPASVLAPFQYLEIIGATLMGYLVFGEFPDRLTWLGAAIILASGFYVFHRERRQQARAMAQDVSAGSSEPGKRSE